jgi:hypothetical protein
MVIFWGFVGGVMAWFATTFIGQPIITFFAARSEAARVLALFGQLDRYDNDPERDEFPDNIVLDRQKALAAAGAQLIAFAYTNQFLIRFLHKLKWSRPNLTSPIRRAKNAGDDLILLSQLKPAGDYNERCAIESCVR